MMISNIMTMERLEAILNFFPNAAEGRAITKNIVHYLAIEHKVTAKNSLFGFSTCPDEINRTVTRFNSHYGEKQFPLGGLTGYPFTGKTGFAAFSHHAPNNGTEGNLIILYAPHVGISAHGELGKILREEQLHESAACGAATAFLKRFREARKQGRDYLPLQDPLDMQQCHIETIMLPHGDRIISSENPLKELVNVNYGIIEYAVTEIVDWLAQDFRGRIYLIGGVMVNAAPSSQNFFELRRFEMHQRDRVEHLLKDLKV